MTSPSELLTSITNSQSVVFCCFIHTLTSTTFWHFKYLRFWKILHNFCKVLLLPYKRAFHYSCPTMQLECKLKMTLCLCFSWGHRIVWYEDQILMVLSWMLLNIKTIIIIVFLISHLWDKTPLMPQRISKAVCETIFDPSLNASMNKWWVGQPIYW